MAISIVQRVTYTATGNSTPSSQAITNTTAGNTLVIVQMQSAASTPNINGTSILTLGGSQYSGGFAQNIYVLSNCPANLNTISWGINRVPALMVVYELSPCSVVANSGATGSMTGTETCPAITASAAGQFFLNTITCATGLTQSNFTAVSSPWFFDFAGSIAAGLQGVATPAVAGGVAYIQSGSGTQQAVWTSNGPSGGFGCTSVVFASTAPPPPTVTVGPPFGGSSSGSCSNLNIAPATQLYGAYVAQGAMNLSQYTTEGRLAFVVDFNSGDGLYSRDIGTVFSWGITNHLVLRVWQPSIIQMPEQSYNRPSDWIDGGNLGNKFIQGISIQADSFGVPKTFQLQSGDDLSLHALNEMPATFVKQTIMSFSCVTPFLAHNVRIVSTDGVPWRVWGVGNDGSGAGGPTITSQPWPSQATTWQTELTSFGMTGWIHDREMNIAYASSNPVTITLTPDVGPPVTITVPASGGPTVQVKQKVTLPPMKFKMLSVKVTSTGPFYLFDTDAELKLKQWGSTGPYQVLKVAGGQSSTGAQV